MKTAPTPEEYTQAAKQLLKEGKSASDWHLQFAKTETNEWEPNFVVHSNDPNEVSSHYSAQEFIEGTMFMFLDPDMPEFIQEQQLRALTHAVRAAIEVRELHTMASAVQVNLNDPRAMEGIK